MPAAMNGGPAIEGRYRFTLGHEGGGHWRLHRPLVEANSGQKSLFGDTRQPTVVCRSSQSNERVELQANLYASCLLMPRKLVFQAWRDRFGNDEMTQLTGALRNAGELRVVDRAADVMVLGTVERAAGHVLVTARLVRTANRYQLWAHTYEFDPPGDSAALAQTIATAVRAELHIRPDR
jgi:hypothetical protein